MKLNNLILGIVSCVIIGQPSFAASKKSGIETAESEIVRIYKHSFVPATLKLNKAINEDKANEAKRAFSEALYHFANMRATDQNNPNVTNVTFTLLRKLREIREQFGSAISNSSYSDLYNTNNFIELTKQAIDEFKKIVNTDPANASILLNDINSIYWMMKAESQEQIQVYLGVGSVSEWIKKQQDKLRKIKSAL